MGVAQIEKKNTNQVNLSKKENVQKNTQNYNTNPTFNSTIKPEEYNCSNENNKKENDSSNFKLNIKQNEDGSLDITDESGNTVNTTRESFVNYLSSIGTSEEDIGKILSGEKTMQDVYKEQLKNMGVSEEDINKIMSGEKTMGDIYKEQLSSMGYTEKDIDRLLKNEITIDELNEEIEKDKDTTRLTKLIEIQYLLNIKEEMEKNEDSSAQGIKNVLKDVKNMDDLQSVIDNQKKELEKNKNERDKLQGEIDNLRTNTTIMANGAVVGLTKEQQETINDNTKKIAELDLEGQEQLIKTLEQMQKEIKDISKINSKTSMYTKQDDYETNSKFVNQEEDLFKRLRSEFFKTASKGSQLSNTDQYTASGSQANITEENIQVVKLYNKKDEVDALYYLLNGQVDHKGNVIKNGDTSFGIISDSGLFEHYAKWLDNNENKEVITDEEIKTFNYIYNTEGTEKAFDYLDELKKEVDIRNVQVQGAKDSELAKEMPILTSIGSVLLKPFYGLRGTLSSFDNKMKGKELLRSDSYSASDIWRSSVAQNIATSFGTDEEGKPTLLGQGFSFAYSTGMSMSDSLYLQAMNSLTGGTMAPILSAAMMGSSAYTSTLNDGLSRGLSDDDAMKLAFGSAVFESVMENWSLGHLTNMEGSLKITTQNLRDKVSSLGSPNLIKAFNCIAGAVSQGICEGEEELATSVADFILDNYIANDKSSFNLAIKQYEEEGMSEEEAITKALEDTAADFVLSFVGGFASGGIRGGAASYKVANQSYENVKESLKTTDIDSNNNDISISEAMNQGIKQYELVQDLVETLQKARRAEILSNIRNGFKNGALSVTETSKKTAETIKSILFDPELEKCYFIPPHLHMFDGVLNGQSEASNQDLTDSTIEDITGNQTIDINQDNTTEELFKKTIESIDDHDKFIENIDKIKSLSDSDKQRFIKELISSGKIDSINDTDSIKEMLSDPIIMQELIDTINTSIEKGNDERRTAIKLLGNLSITDFNKVFQDDKIKSQFDQMATSDFKEILKGLSRNNMNFLQNETIVTKILSLSDEEFLDVCCSLSYTLSLEFNRVYDSLDDSSIYYNLLEEVHKRFINENTYFKYYNKIKMLVNRLYLESSDRKYEKICSIVDKINSKKDSLNNTARQKIQEASGGVLKTDTNGNLLFSGDNNDIKAGYYDLTYEINGEVKTIEQQYNGNGRFLFSPPEDIMSAAYNNNLKIISLEQNVSKSNAVITTSMGLDVGLNEIEVVVDGTLKKIVIEHRFGDSTNIYYTLGKPKNLEVLSVKHVGSFNVTGLNQGDSYKITIETDNGQIIDYASVNGRGVLDIDSIISEKDLTGVKKCEVTPISITEVISELQTITGFKASTDIFSETGTYGGDQSDVPRLLKGLFNGAELTKNESQKAQIINSLIDQYFSGLSDIDKIKIAEHYAHGGCMYMAIANVFATYMGSINGGPEIFKERFGYDLTVTDGEKTAYNLEAIAFEIYLNHFSNLGITDIDDILVLESGINMVNFNKMVGSLFEKKGIKLTYDELPFFALSLYPPDTKQTITKVLLYMFGSKNMLHVLSAGDFSMIRLDSSDDTREINDGALENSTLTTKEEREHVGGHAMAITGVDENGDLIVSSWCGKYRVPIDAILENARNGSKDAHFSIKKIMFSILDEVSHNNLEETNKKSTD